MTITPKSKTERTSVIDCDVHESLFRIQDLFPYMAPRWRDFIGADVLRRVPPNHAYVPPPDLRRHRAQVHSAGVETAAAAAPGATPTSKVAKLGVELLDAFGVDYAILMGAWSFSAMPQPELAAGIASAYNDWLIDRWLSKDDRLRGSITLAPQLPRLAAREIDRVGTHPQMVQVGLGIASPGTLWGASRFDPIWEAAVRHDLRVGFHVTVPVGVQGLPSLGGWPSTYMELRSGFGTIYQTQLISMVSSGLFARFPKLRVSLVEGGFAWLPGVMWRMDASWRAMRGEVPWLKQAPSEYVRSHVRLTTQPMEEPADPKHLLQLIDMMGSEDLLMFSTDYPHWDFESPTASIPPSVGRSLRRKILWANASDFYGFPEPGVEKSAARASKARPGTA